MVALENVGELEDLLARDKRRDFRLPSSPLNVSTRIFRPRQFSPALLSARYQSGIHIERARQASSERPKQILDKSYVMPILTWHRQRHDECVIALTKSLLLEP